MSRPALLLLLALAALPSRSQAQAARAATGDAAGGSKSPFRGSTVVYEHAASAISASKSFEPTWNPYYMHNLSLRPEWHPDAPIFFRARLTLFQELTNADDTTYKYETVLSDLWLDGIAPGWTEPNSKVRFGGSLRVLLPTSKASQAQTMLFGLSPAVVATRSFDVLKGLIVGFTGRVTTFFNRSTTSVFDGPTIPCAELDSPQCLRFQHSGVRNTSWSAATGPLVILSPIDPLSLTMSAAVFRSALYPLTTWSKPLPTGPVSLGEGNGVDARYVSLFSVDATWTINPTFAVAAGFYTWASQLGPDGQHRNPFVNRTTALYLDLVIDAERLAATATGRP